MDREVVRCLEVSISNDVVSIKKAGQQLQNWTETNPERVLNTLCSILAADPNTVDKHLLQTAAILLKNAVKAHWEEWISSNESAVEVLKRSIIDLTLRSSDPIKAYLLETLEIMSEEIFPTHWQGPLSVLNLIDKASFSPTGTEGGGGVVPLETVETAVEILLACTAKFESVSENSLAEIKYILDTADQRIFGLFKASAEAHITSVNAVPSRENVYAGNGQVSRETCLAKITSDSLEIIKVLHGVDLPAFFEDNIATLFTLIIQLLDTPDYGLNELDDGCDSPSISDKIKDVCCQLVHSYLTKFIEVFTPYSQDCILAVLRTAEKCSQRMAQDQLVQSAVQCVCGAIRISGAHSTLFENSQVFTRIFKNIIGTNSVLTDQDVEKLEDEPMMFVRQEIEGADHGRRREAIRSLIHSLMVPTALTNEARKQILAFVDSLLTEAKKSNNAILKEAATFLFSAGVTKSSQTRAVKEVYDLGQVVAYLEREIVPTLDTVASEVSIPPPVAINCSAALRFLSNFRNFIPMEAFDKLLPVILKHLMSSSVVLQSSAAATLERILVLRPNMTPYVNIRDAKILASLESVIDPLLNSLMTNAGVTDNEFVMKAIWRLLAVCPAGEIQAERLRKLVQLSLSDGLKRANPVFAHYVFESMAVISHMIVLTKAELVLEVHKFVIEAMNAIMSSTEAHPFAQYSYQILACLTETLPLDPKDTGNIPVEELRALYLYILAGLLKKERWTTSVSNICAIINLLNTFLRRSWLFGDHLNSSVPAMLDGFHIALSQSKVDTAQTCEYLNHIVVKIDPVIMQQYISVLVKICVEGMFKRGSKMKLKDAQKCLTSLAACIIIFEMQPSHKKDQLQFNTAMFITEINKIRSGALQRFASLTQEISALPTTPLESYVLITALGYILLQPQIRNDPALLELFCKALVLQSDYFKESLSRSEKKEVDTLLSEGAANQLSASDILCEQGDGIDKTAAFNRLVTSKGRTSKPILTDCVNETHIRALYAEVAKCKEIYTYAASNEPLAQALKGLLPAS